MARISGVDLPRNKKMHTALTYIYGVGKTTALKVLKAANIDPDLRSDNLTDGDAAKIRDTFGELGVKVEGELRKEISMNIKRLIDLSSYRGIRHRRGLPVRGQRTSSNARTRKGPAKAIQGKKSVKSMK
jgi:small subunit ribosomal protein S13